MKRYIIFNLFIQLFWVAIALAIGVFIACKLFESLIWRIIFGGIFSFITYGLMFQLSNYIKDMKNPDVLKAYSLRLTKGEYNKMKKLFENMLIDERVIYDELKDLYSEILVNHPKEWKAYCLSRTSDYKPLYSIGKKISAFNEDSEKCVDGIITDIEFGFGWWEYNVVFSEELSIKNQWPSKTAKLSSKDICDIETGKVSVSSNHYF